MSVTSTPAVGNSAACAHLLCFIPWQRRPDTFWMPLTLRAPSHALAQACHYSSLPYLAPVHWTRLYRSATNQRRLAYAPDGLLLLVTAARDVLFSYTSQQAEDKIGKNMLKERDGVS